MQNADQLITGTKNSCFAAASKIYTIYLPNGGSTAIQLPHGKYGIKWYNPRTGGALLEGSIKTIQGPGQLSIGNPPGDPQKDWAVLVKLSTDKK